MIGGVATQNRQGRRVRLLCLAAGAVLLSPAAAHAGSAKALTTAQAAAVLAKRLSPLVDPQGPGCVSALARDGGLIAVRADGLANLELQVAMTPDSVFDIGSTSKQFTATSIAILARRGKIDLDADIRVYLPEMNVRLKPITVRQLIGHSGGLPDPYAPLSALFGDQDGDLYPSDYTLKMAYGADRLDFEPGEKYAYSNVGYLLLGQIVERVSGQTLRVFAEQNIFAPLGMTHTHFHDDFHELVRNRASAYGLKVDGKTWEWRHSDFTVMGDGGVYSTVGDLAKWYDNFRHPKLEGGQALVDLLLTPGKYRSTGPTYLGKPVEYGFGTMMFRSGSHPVIGHPGGWAGFGSIPFYMPDTDLSLLILCNHQDHRVLDKAMALVDELAGG